MPRSQLPRSQPTAILFVDPCVDLTVNHLSVLPTQMASKAELLELAADQDGVEQITEALRERRGLQCLHIVASGGLGSLQLGTAQLTLFNLDRYGWELQQWGEALLAGAEIVFHEELSAENGASQLSGGFLSRLHLLTGAKIRLAEAQVQPQSVGF